MIPDKPDLDYWVAGLCVSGMHGWLDVYGIVIKQVAAASAAENTLGCSSEDTNSDWHRFSSRRICVTGITSNGKFA